jgi:predicted TIM-barrel fold metal-dependent hydrolase
MPEIPKIVSVDDHVIEPPGIWTDRLPAKYREVGPRVIDKPMKHLSYVGGVLSWEEGEHRDDGPMCSWWYFEDLHYPMVRTHVAVGFPRDQLQMAPITYDEMIPGAWQREARLADMDRNHMESSLCFPSWLRFCGQHLSEGKDKELGLRCVEAYNDWMVEEWCAGSGGRMIPLCVVPLWDATLAAGEVRRNAARGVRAVAFSEIPPNLGLPSIHSGSWDPFFAACSDTGTVLCMHIGSGSKMPSTSADAPGAVGSALVHTNAIFSMVDYLMSGVFVRFPGLRVMYSEGQAGWLPYMLDRVDVVWDENRAWGGVADKVPDPPSTYIRDHVYFCVFQDKVAFENLDVIPVENLTYEVDYPHSDSTWPRSREIAERHMKKLTQEQVDAICRDNAVRLFGLTPEGRWRGA